MDPAEEARVQANKLTVYELMREQAAIDLVRKRKAYEALHDRAEQLNQDHDATFLASLDPAIADSDYRRALADDRENLFYQRRQAIADLTQAGDSYNQFADEAHRWADARREPFDPNSPTDNARKAALEHQRALDKLNRLALARNWHRREAFRQADRVARAQDRNLPVVRDKITTLPPAGLNLAPGRVAGMDAIVAPPPMLPLFNLLPLPPMPAPQNLGALDDDAMDGIDLANADLAGLFGLGRKRAKRSKRCTCK